MAFGGIEFGLGQSSLAPISSWQIHSFQRQPGLLRDKVKVAWRQEELQSDFSYLARRYFISRSKMKRTHSQTSSRQRTVLSLIASTNPNPNQTENAATSVPRVRSISERVSWADLQGKSRTQLVMEKFEVPLVPMETLKLISRAIDSNDLNNWMTTCKATYWAADQCFELRRAPTLLALAKRCYQSAGRLGLERLMSDIVDRYGFWNHELIASNSERVKAFMSLYALTMSIDSSEIGLKPCGEADRVKTTYLPYINKLHDSDLAIAICDFSNSDLAQRKLLSSLGKNVLPLLHARIKQMRVEQMEMITHACADAITKYRYDPDMKSALQEQFFREWAESGAIKNLCTHLGICRT